MEISKFSPLSKAQPIFDMDNNIQSEEVSIQQRPQQTPQNSKNSIENEIAGINKWLQSANSHIKFTLHEELNEYYVQVINDQTNEIIREIPSKKIMDMVAKMHEMIGLLVDEKR